MRVKEIRLERQGVQVRVEEIRLEIRSKGESEGGQVSEKEYT